MLAAYAAEDVQAEAQGRGHAVLAPSTQGVLVAQTIVGHHEKLAPADPHEFRQGCVPISTPAVGDAFKDDQFKMIRLEGQLDCALAFNDIEFDAGQGQTARRFELHALGGRIAEGGSKACTREHMGRG